MENIGVGKTRKCVNVFADILGFKEKIQIESESLKTSECTEKFANFSIRFAKTIESIIDVMKNTSKYWNGSFYAFSDCILINCPINEVSNEESDVNNVFFAIQDSIYIIYLLCGEGYFMRGGISTGCTFESTSITFGPGIVQSVELEEKANYPRIVIDQNILSYFDKMIQNGDAENYTKWILYDEMDDCWFINYLYCYIELSKMILCRESIEKIVSENRLKKLFNSQKGNNEGESEFRIIDVNDLDFTKANYIIKTEAPKFTLFKNLIEKGLSHPTEKVRKKYFWLAQYHNWFYNLYMPGIPQIRISGVPDSDRFKTYDKVTYSRKKPIDIKARSDPE